MLGSVHLDAIISPRPQWPICSENLGVATSPRLTCGGHRGLIGNALSHGEARPEVSSGRVAIGCRHWCIGTMHPQAHHEVLHRNAHPYKKPVFDLCSGTLVRQGSFSFVRKWRGACLLWHEHGFANWRVPRHVL